MGYSIGPLLPNRWDSDSNRFKTIETLHTCDSTCSQNESCNKFFVRFRLSSSKMLKSLLIAYIISFLFIHFFSVIDVVVVSSADIWMVAILPCCGFTMMSFLIWLRVIDVYSEGLRIRILFRFWEVRWQHIKAVQLMDNGNIVLHTVVINEIILPPSILRIPKLLDCVRSRVGDEHVFTIFLMNGTLPVR